MRKIILMVTVICFIAILAGCSKDKINTDSQSNTTDTVSVTASLERMIFVNGELYVATGDKSQVEHTCGTPDGAITSQVDNTEKPSQDNQSNFGEDFDYQFGYENQIEVLIDGVWWVFEKQS